MKQYFYITIFVLIAGITNVIAQSADRNYIKTTTYLDAASATSLKSVQYFDGLGRPVQTVQQNAGPSNNNQDLISVQEYDAFGRDSKAWLPVYRTANTGTYYTGTIATDTKNQYGNDTYAYSEPVYEASPLNRVIQQYGPGQAWRTPTSRPVKTEYLANTASDCIYYYMSGDVLNKNAYYAANTLYVTKTTDEDNKVSYEFKDKLGRIILQRQTDGSENFDTYYVYDDFGNLRWVLPPMFNIQYMAQSCAYYGYYYKYDDRNRCIEKKLPGAEPVLYVYDKADRLIFSQDGEQRNKPLQEWIFNIPDDFGRIVLTGVCGNTFGTSTISNAIFKSKIVKATYNGGSAYNVNYGYKITVDGTEVMLPGTVKILSVNYYDNYKFKTYSADFSNTNYNQNNALPTGFENKIYGAVGDSIKSKGLQTGSVSVMLDNPNTKINSIFYYDSRGRMIQSIASNHLGGHEKEYINYSFTGNPSWKQSIHTAILNSVTNTVTETYTYAYDHADRPTTTKYKLNSDPEFILSTLTYDNQGRIATKKQSEAVGTTTYSYNIRNWFTNINVQIPVNNVVFDEKLYYNDSYASNTPRYNGNISAVSWRYMVNSSIQGYRYTYDGLNRLKMGQYLSGTTASNLFTEEVTQYDKNGNILRMKRYARASPQDNTGTLVDDLSMYDNKGNQIVLIADLAPASAPTIGFVMPNASCTMNPIVYNSNGAMKQNYYNGIAGITYNVLNLPEKVRFMYGHGIQYSYDASGTKRKVVHQTAKSGVVVPLGTTAYTPNASDIQSTLTTDYCAGGHIVYENGSLKRILNPEGYVVKQSNGTYTYYYYAKDHLGNNRAVFEATALYFSPRQEISYYPFGMPHQVVYAPNDGVSPEFQPYKFGDKEYDEMHGLNWYDFGARYYNGIVPMFMTIDPLAEKYYNMSPYCAFANNPVNNVDPTGKDWYRQGESGTVIWQEGNAASITAQNQTYNNIGTTYTDNYEGGSITYEQNEAVSMTEDILNTGDFHTQMNSNGTKKSGQEGNCFYQSGLMVAESGAESLGGTSNDISTYDGMLDYLDSQADAGYSTRVHVDRNDDGNGDHWVAISSRTTNLRTNSTASFGFFDPGTSHPNLGTSSTNQFTVGAATLSGNTAYSGSNYVIVNVRRNR